MTAEAASAKAAELADLVKLAANPAWKNLLEPAFAKARTAHLEAATAKGASPADRAEHVEAYHLANDLLGLVPERIRRLREQIVAHQAASGETTFTMGDAAALE